MSILTAAKLAMERAAEKATVGLCIVDAVRDLYPSFPIPSIVRATEKREMAICEEQYSEYGFDRNMGYGTEEHTASFRQYGPTPMHCKTFIRYFLKGGAKQ